MLTLPVKTVSSLIDFSYGVICLKLSDLLAQDNKPIYLFWHSVENVWGLLDNKIYLVSRLQNKNEMHNTDNKASRGN